MLFFFQAEDGIRDIGVTGVQTCALPICALFFCGISVQTFAQGRTVKGTVTAADDNSALPGVNVVVKGTSTGTITDPNGGYSLSIPGDNATLVFSFIGYTTEEVVVGTRSTKIGRAHV